MKTKKWKRALSVVLAGTMAVTALSAGMTAFAAEDDFYPEGVTAEQAGQAVTTVDTVLNDADLLKLVSGLVNGAQDVVKLPENAENLKDLAEQVIEENLFTDATVTAVVKMIYPALISVLGDSASLASIIGINVYPKDVAKAISNDYADAKAAISAADKDWNAVDWTQVKWNVTDEDSFYKAMGQGLNGLNALLNVILNKIDAGSALAGLKGIEGYRLTIVPILTQLGCKDLMTPEEYKADTSTEALVRNLLTPILNRVYEICDAPASNLMAVLPQLAYFLSNDGIKSVLTPLVIQGKGLASSVNVNIWDMLSASVDLSDINALLKSLVEGAVAGFTWVDVDFAALAGLGTTETVKNVSGDDYVKVTADVNKVTIAVLRYVGEVLNANADLIKNAIPSMDETLAAVLVPIIDKALAMTPDQFAALVINLLAPTDAPVSAYNYPTIEKVDFAYPEGVLYGEDAYAAAPAAIDGLLAGFGLNLADLVGGALYTNELINSVLGLYDTIAANQTVMDVFAALGINTDFAAVKAAAQAINVTDKASFIDALTTALSPFDDVLAMVLAGQDYDVFGYVVPGMDAYNTVVIPLLEVLGCTNVMSYADYQAAVANGASPLEAILTQALDRVDEILASPVDSIVEILPNLAYFLDSNNLSVMIKNVASPVIQLLSYVDIDAMAVVNDLLKAYNIPAIDDLDNDLAGLLNQVLGLIKINDAPLGIQLPAIDLHVLASYGTAEAYTSAMVIDGQNVQATRIVADKADVTGAVIGYLYSVLSDPATVDTIVGLLGESGSMVSGILSGLLGNGEAGFTNALFELLGLPMKGEDGSSDGNNNVNTGDTTIAVVAGAAVLAAGAVLLLARKKKEN